MKNYVKKVKTPLISDIDFDRPVPPLIELSELPECIMKSQFIEYTRSAGTGKTYTVTSQNFYDMCMVVPNNNLKIKFQTENPDMPCLTYHKAFGMNAAGDASSNPDPPPRYSTYAFEEVSMICKGMFNKCMRHPYIKDANIIVIHDLIQLNPVVPASFNWAVEKSPYFTNAEEYLSRTWQRNVLTEQKRQTDPELLRRLTALRELWFENRRSLNCEQLQENTAAKLALFADRVITDKQVQELYPYDHEDLILASTNERVNSWNRILKKSCPPGGLKIKFIKSTQKFAKNQRLINQIDMDPTKHELAFASTIHLVQGVTFKDRIFISRHMINFDSALLYVAASRAKTLDQVFLVD